VILKPKNPPQTFRPDLVNISVPEKLPTTARHPGDPFNPPFILKCLDALYFFSAKNIQAWLKAPASQYERLSVLPAA
jgi:hypothetical protein